MIKVLFVCHGNICRSPIAEFVFKDMVKRYRLDDKFLINSAATSREEIGNGIYPPAREIMEANGVSCGEHRAVQVRRSDYDNYDYILIMDQRNLKNIGRIFGGDPQNKVHLLLDWDENPRDISDPWYTRDFQRAFEDIRDGCRNFLEYLRLTCKV